MKFLFDLFPVILFFIAYKFSNIYAATLVVIGATIFQVIYSKLVHKRVDKLLIFNAVLISILGGTTLWLHDANFIKWKPSILYWLLSGALLFFQFFKKKNLVKNLMGKQIQLTEKGWDQISITSAVFFGVLGALNLYIAFNFSESTWVNFKLFGITGLIMCYAVLIGILASRANHK
ncbi:septation protein A [Candidatus Methylopumilus universalis]|uniref:septation protein A n=1 Tax=Candidatus Methylopumilus universalis TaxID=2588536 RepID=UPI001123E12C|nr:septation protein A [Candidatus Methylopumilus universalis]QDC96113.1 septation protein A [Candidatus Methylopumilus universalis]